MLSNMVDARKGVFPLKNLITSVFSLAHRWTPPWIFWSCFFFIARNYQTVANGDEWLLQIVTDPPLLFTDHYWLFLILLVINVYHWLLLIMVINVDFTPHYDLSIAWFSLLPNISNDLSSPQEQEEMQNPLVLHLLCFPTGLWLNFFEPDLKMKFSGLGL